MLIKAALVRLVIIRRDDKNGISTSLFGVLRKFDCFNRVIGTSTRNHRNATCCYFDADLDNTLVLIMRQGRCFACCTNRYEPFGALFDLPVHKSTKGFLVERSFTIEWRDKCSNRAFQHQ
ncbi:hypothetical protein FQZ97_1128210 [compost metagenome]